MLRMFDSAHGLSRLGTAIAALAAAGLLAACVDEMAPSDTVDAPTGVELPTVPGPATAVPTLEGSPGGEPMPLPVPVTCVEPEPGQLVYEDAAGGWCAAYPEGAVLHVSEDPTYRAVTFAFPAEDVPVASEPRTASLTIEAKGSLEGLTLDDKVSEVVEMYAGSPGIDIVRTEGTIAGLSMIILDGMPGLFTVRQAYFAHADSWYGIVVLPWEDPQMDDLQPLSQELWDTVTASYVIREP